MERSGISVSVQGMGGRLAYLNGLYPAIVFGHIAIDFFGVCIAKHIAHLLCQLPEKGYSNDKFNDDCEKTKNGIVFPVRCLCGC
jgi:hypothetical protein